MNLERFVVFLSELSEVLSSVLTGTSVKANLSESSENLGLESLPFITSLGAEDSCPIPDRSWLMSLGIFPQMELEFRVNTKELDVWHWNIPDTEFLLLCFIPWVWSCCSPELTVRSWSCISQTHCHGNGVECPKSAFHAVKALPEMMDWGKKINGNRLQG